MPKLSNREVALKKLEKLEELIIRAGEQAVALHEFLDEIQSKESVKKEIKKPTTGKPRGRKPKAK